MGRDQRLLVPNWRIKSGECWIISGPGGSGKSSLARAVAGVPDSHGYNIPVSGMERRTPLDDGGAWISFDRENEIRSEMRHNDDSEWTGRPDEGSSLESFLGGSTGLRLLDAGLLQKLEGRGIRNLSTGEFRQVLIAREAGHHPDLIVLDEPWEGLDVAARPRLSALLADFRDSGALVVITVNREDDIPDFATGLIRIVDGKAIVTDFASRLQKTSAKKESETVSEPYIPPPPELSSKVAKVLIRMVDVNLSYQGRQILKNINWTVKQGESWLLTGPNGSGKTSLLNLINGDEPRAFGQNISIFGVKKGSGESTTWILEHIGRVSAALQEKISRHSVTTEVIGSGLRNSLILVDPLDGYEKDLVENWIKVLGLHGCEETPFFRLPYGQRRLAMIGRAMINHPPLLLLDEPMHGLDRESRARIADLVDTLIQETSTSVLFVSHRPEDAPASVLNHIRLIPGEKSGPSMVSISPR